MELLKEEWKGLHYFKRSRYEPVLKDFGSVYDRNHGRRSSRRIAERLLLTLS